jgi:hypothetical protein
MMVLDGGTNKPERETASLRMGGRFVGGISGITGARLPAEASVVPAMVEMTTDDDGPMFEMNEWSAANDADEVPVARNPVAAVIVAGYPGVSGARAGRHIGHRAANGYSKLSGLGRVRSKAQSASNECRA